LSLATLGDTETSLMGHGNTQRRWAIWALCAVAVLAIVATVLLIT
jgi:hypothetical protein